jgi:hypothetical protein
MIEKAFNVKHSDSSESLASSLSVSAAQAQAAARLRSLLNRDS